MLFHTPLMIDLPPTTLMTWHNNPHFRVKKMNMGISHSKPVAELELEPRSFDSKSSALADHREAEPTITMETHLQKLLSRSVLGY